MTSTTVNTDLRDLLQEGRQFYASPNGVLELIHVSAADVHAALNSPESLEPKRCLACGRWSTKPCLTSEIFGEVIGAIYSL